MERISRTTPALAASRDVQPHDRRLQPIQQHSTEHMGPPRAERNANADLTSALRHQLREHALEPGGSQQERDYSKGQHQDGIELQADSGLADALAQ
jgi:hypothetical protein